MDGKTPHLLPPSEAKKEIRDDVPLVCAWALINAFSIVSGAASGYTAAYFRIACIQSSFILPCIQLTDAEEARLIALFVGMLCCAASQAAAAALALLLPRHRRWPRRALAYLALAVTILFHCMYASTIWILHAADSGYILGRIYYTVIICFMVVCDLLSCVALLLEVMGGASMQCVA
ncbi:uncharacterized protein LOC119297780 [Triticum dicoccoides]|uniref:uncharacterized protein LOC119297780 n=1 Tax=Triticum dicoccoides TaxID=85692 RepID=UPI00188FBCDF|nr:uncharacterized protein LOC119297780 [Triticum dicoccoides]XP_037431328.1 uncharacterized protein LOC119297780 [Triticum dicoccoides]